MRNLRGCTLVGAALALAVLGCSSDDSGGASRLLCSEEAPRALRTCLDEWSAATADCYRDGNAPCAAGDAGLEAALAALESDVAASCGDGELFGLSSSAVVGRLRNACSSQAASLAWRTYGGPQGAVWPVADAAERDCLATAHAAASSMMGDALAAIDACLSGGSGCAGVEDARQAMAESALGEVEAACDELETLIAVDAATYVERAEHQVDCLVATVHADRGSMALSCGPSNADFDPPRGEFMQVVVDGDKWGTMCGDGSDYAFQIRLAPPGERLDRILIGLQGGGVCLFEDDCRARLASAPGLFNAMDDEPIGSGIASDNPNENPFANWTKIYLPYCNQDVFTGGGVFEPLGDLDLPRFGGVNLRAAIQMSRDVIWKLMDEEGGDGFRPDEIIALFGGWSAGGYGTIYNYHWLLDDLQWPRTAAFPDAGGALDNGSIVGVSGLGDIKIPAWGTLHNLPPYCFAGSCAVGPTLYETISPRLKQVPEQQMLILSNPKDNTQQGDAFFDDEAFWINTMRQSYCDTRDLNGIHYYYTSVSDESVHVVSLRPELWAGEVDGETMRDWFVRAVTEPDTLMSRVEEADFVDAIPGVEPYPCEVAP